MASQKEWNDAFNSMLNNDAKQQTKKNEKQEDWVNHPSHYNGHKIKTAKGEFEYETIDLITSEVNRLVSKGIPAESAYCIGNAIKYIERTGEKPGDYGKDQTAKSIEDLQKVVWYINKAVQLFKN